MTAINETHDASLRSWVESANAPGTDFPIQNLPFGVFRYRGSKPRVGVAIGDQIVDVAACHLEGAAARACEASTLNNLMALDPAEVSSLRAQISRSLRQGASERSRVDAALVPMHDAELLLPAAIGDYTDFYASVFHAINVGKLFRPDNPLLPNYKYVPTGYHGRASSIVPSGTPVHRPSGQTKDAKADVPEFGPSRRLDYELEVGFFVSGGNPQGEPISIDDAGRHIFGLCLVNDWSARDIQAWEYQPLGPFLAKSFSTSISPWVVTMEALAPFRTAAFDRPPGDPAPLSYLSSAEDQAHGGLDLKLEVYLSSAKMRQQNLPSLRLSHGNFCDMYWTIAQMLTHHTSNGCNLRPGDLLASGTVSGPDKDNAGCLLELTRGGAEPLALPAGETRRFLEDSDEIILRGYCDRPGFVRIGLPECRGIVGQAVTAGARRCE